MVHNNPAVLVDRQGYVSFGGFPQKMNYVFILADSSAAFLPISLYPYLLKTVYSYLPITKKCAYIDFAIAGTSSSDELQFIDTLPSPSRKRYALRVK